MKRKLKPTIHCPRKNPGKFNILMVLFFLTMVWGEAWALDEFQGIKCGADVPKSLIGKRASNERVAALEERHKDLGLKDMGGTEISSRLFLASWRICGSEYELLVNTKTGTIRDVLQSPPHSKTSPQYIGKCQADRRQGPEVFVAVLNNSPAYDARDPKLSNTMLKATAAWTIDETKEKFVKYPTEKLECPLGGISTLDGGP